MHGDEFEETLHSIGEDEVRKRLSRGLYSFHQRDIVTEWLRKQDVKAQRRARSFDQKMQWSILIISAIAAIASIASLLTK